MAHLPQLRNADAYRACEWDLKVDAGGRRYWVKLFCEHLELLAAAISDAYPEAPPGALAAFRSEYLATMHDLEDRPERYARIDILVLDELRTALQTRYGFDDPYRGIKARENRLALTVLPELLAELDAAPPDTLAEKLALGLMAGNIFDFGAAAAVERFNSVSSDFERLKAVQPRRPWHIDDLEAWSGRWRAGRAYEHVAFFVDNAGSDICLGCLPLVRWMLDQGTRVTLAANSGPALNDVTASELLDLLQSVARRDTRLASAQHDRKLSVIGSGGWAPLIDLTQLDDSCADLIADADLIVLHGMGRAVESNWRAAFTCDSLRAAVLKDAEVARSIGGELFDCVFRFEPTG